MSVDITHKSTIRHRPIGTTPIGTITLPEVPRRRSLATKRTAKTKTDAPKRTYSADGLETSQEDTRTMEPEADEEEEAQTQPLDSADEQEVPVRHPQRTRRASASQQTNTPTYRNTYELAAESRPQRRRASITRRLPESEIPKRNLHWLLWLGLGMLLLLVFNVGLVLVRNAVYMQFLTVTTSKTPTAQLDATVHGSQMHFVAVELHQHIEIIALDETDPKQTTLYAIANPALLGQSEPVTLGLALRDINGDQKSDLVITTTTASVNFFWQPTMMTSILANVDGLHFKPL